jgi:hypothetical protein
MLQDADDIISYPSRLRTQLSGLEAPECALLGGKFDRSPSDATRHYTAWANSLTEEQLVRCTQISSRVALARLIHGIVDSIGRLYYLSRLFRDDASI